MKVAVTGATGAVGMALVRLHVARGDEVLAITHPGSSRTARLREVRGVRTAEAGLDQYPRLGEPPGYDVFYHLAWEGGTRRNDWASNLRSATASLQAVELAARLGCAVFIGAGSQAECGPQATPIGPDTACAPDTPFGAAKLAALHCTRVRAAELGLRFAWARILSVYGPYDGERTLVTSTIRTLLRGGTPQFTSGTQHWDFLYADDAAAALAAVADHGGAHGIFAVGSGTARPLKEHIAAILAPFGLPADPYLGLVPAPPHAVRYLVADIGRLANECGWTPAVGFAEGIARTIAHCQTHAP